MSTGTVPSVVYPSVNRIRRRHQESGVSVFRTCSALCPRCAEKGRMPVKTPRRARCEDGVDRAPSSSTKHTNQTEGCRARVQAVAEFHPLYPARLNSGSWENR